jgi:hypothetical protein
LFITFSFYNYDEVIINKNIPKNYKQLKLTLPLSKLSPRIYDNSRGLISSNNIVIGDDDNDNDNKVGFNADKQNIKNYFSSFR